MSLRPRWSKQDFSGGGSKITQVYTQIPVPMVWVSQVCHNLCDIAGWNLNPTIKLALLKWFQMSSHGWTLMILNYKKSRYTPSSMDEGNNGYSSIRQTLCPDHLKIFSLAGAWWHTRLIPALGRQRQVNLWVWDQPSPHSKFQDSLGYTEKPEVKKNLKKTN